MFALHYQANRILMDATYKAVETTFAGMVCG
jgi:hypothetical protein